MKKPPEINHISSICFDLEESFRSLIASIEKLRQDVDELIEWREKTNP